MTLKTLFLIILLTLGTVYAQAYVGLRSGYPLGFSFHLGLEGAVTGGSDLRLSGSAGGGGFGVGLDVLSPLAVEGPVRAYVGGGPAVVIGDEGTLIDLHGLLGGEFRFTPVGLDPLGVFAEVSLGAGIGVGRPSAFPTLSATLGANYHF